ncbi:MAG: type II toxin-antitoxin system VapC family toxin [Pirellulales bacterium]
MGSLALPPSGIVYADTQVFIYSVEKHPVYAPILRPLWHEVQAGRLEVVSSELSLMETLVAPLRNRDTALAAAYEQMFQFPGVRLLPITSAVLREAAALRAAHASLRTPDALHAATALLAGCASLLTNDLSFRQITALPVIVLGNAVVP